MPSTLTILFTLVSMTQDSQQASQPGLFEKGGSVTLRIEYLSGSICELTVESGLHGTNKRGWVALSCDGRKTHRAMSAKEEEEFLRLARTSRLYSTPGVGKDTRYAHMWLATIKVTDPAAGQAVVILVVSGNRDFGEGPRRDLMQFLRQRLTELRPRLERTPGQR